MAGSAFLELGKRKQRQGGTEGASDESLGGEGGFLGMGRGTRGRGLSAEGSREL